MLEIFNNLKPFFEDVYRVISVREYSRISGLSPPTSSKILNDFSAEGLLIRSKEKIYLNFRVNGESQLFRDLALAYWKEKLSQIFLKMHKDFLFKEIVLFGSLSKCENNLSSDIDIFVDIPKKDILLKEAEKILKRKIQLHFSDAKNNRQLFDNIKKGVKIL